MPTHCGTNLKILDLAARKSDLELSWRDSVAPLLACCCGGVEITSLDIYFDQQNVLVLFHDERQVLVVLAGLKADLVIGEHHGFIIFLLVEFGPPRRIVLNRNHHLGKWNGIVRDV